MLLSKYEETIEHLKTRWQHTDRNFLRNCSHFLPMADQFH